MSIVVLAPGMLSTVQDSGRIGHAAHGIGRAGAMDDTALRLANILVGNVDNAAALEITLRGPRLRFDADALIAIAGAALDARCNDVQVPAWRPVAVRAGCQIAFGGMPHGMRSYIAIGGGIDTTVQLGSRSCDINSGIGGRALGTGDVLRTGREGNRIYRTLWRDHDKQKFVAANWSLDPQVWFDADASTPIRAVATAHFTHLDASSQRLLFASWFRIGAESNRVGYRLEGAALALREPLELVSEGVVPGTLQLPPGGNPIVLMAEAPTCGGYPRIAQVIAVDMPRLAQRRPGSMLRFAETSLDDAQTRYLRRERALARIARGVAERLHE
jgi:antagonist of KipI